MLERIPTSVRESFEQIHPAFYNHSYTDTLEFIGIHFVRKGDLEGIRECADKFEPEKPAMNPKVVELGKMRFFCKIAEAASEVGNKNTSKDSLEKAAAILDREKPDEFGYAGQLNAFTLACIACGETAKARSALEKYLAEIKKNEGLRSLDEYHLLPSFKKLAGVYAHEGNSKEATALVDLLSNPRWQGHLLLAIARALPDENEAYEIIADVETTRIPAISSYGYQEEVLAEVVKTKAAFGNLPEALATMQRTEKSPKSTVVRFVRPSLEAYARIEFSRFTFAKIGKEEAEKILHEINPKDRSLREVEQAYLLEELARAEMQFGNRESAKDLLTRGAKAANAAYHPNSAYASDTGYERQYALEAVGRAMADLGEVDELKKLAEENKEDGHLRDFMLAQAIRAELSRS